MGKKLKYYCQDKREKEDVITMTIAISMSLTMMPMFNLRTSVARLIMKAIAKMKMPLPLKKEKKLK